ncbi:MAG TPA: hypothetical protein VFK28_10285 [Sphingomicrobium sp.]|nr:hypothetical protein [Sphingomicrobium sp.]
MMDELFDRQYQAGREHLNAGIGAGFRTLRRAIGNTFDVLYRIEYDAPWAARARRARSH